MERRPKIIRINLMRGGQEREPTPKKKAPKRISIDTKNANLLAVAMLAISIMVSAAWDYTLISKERRLQSIKNKKQRELSLLEAKTKRLKKIEAELKALREKKRIIGRIVKEAHIPLKVMRSLQRAMPDEVWLSGLSLNDKRIEMKGYSINDEALADFVERLQKEKLISSVSISRYEKTKVNDVTVRRFTGGIRIR